MIMRNNAPAGTLVMYMGATDSQVRWGGCDDPRKVLTEGALYIVEETRIHSYHTKVKLYAVDGWFNSVSFQEV